MTKIILVREQVCIGCRLCEVHCVAAHSRSKDLLKAFKKESPRPLPRLHVEEAEARSLAVRCFHCEDALCIAACLTGAMHRDPATGAVLSDAERCMGCWTCIMVCPYGAIVRDESRHIAVKCDLCPGREVPACVADCPNEALLLTEEA